MQNIGATNMSKIRESARGEQCLVRIPGVCNHNPETVVFAHYRLAGFCGVGMKPPNWMGAYACSACHDCADGRVARGVSTLQAHLYLAEGAFRTQAKLIEKGLLEVVK